MTLKQGVIIALALIAFAVLMKIIADVFDISRTEAGAIEFVIVGILGFAWWRWRRRLEKRPR
jgi:membrane protein implicated in regulation of membrane protease activity